MAAEELRFVVVRGESHPRGAVCAGQIYFATPDQGPLYCWWCLIADASLSDGVMCDVPAGDDPKRARFLVENRAGGGIVARRMDGQDITDMVEFDAEDTLWQGYIVLPADWRLSSRPDPYNMDDLRLKLGGFLTWPPDIEVFRRGDGIWIALEFMPGDIYVHTFDSSAVWADGQTIEFDGGDDRFPAFRGAFSWRDGRWVLAIEGAESVLTEFEQDALRIGDACA